MTKTTNINEAIQNATQKLNEARQKYMDRKAEADELLNAHAEAYRKLMNALYHSKPEAEKTPKLFIAADREAESLTSDSHEAWLAAERKMHTAEGLITRYTNKLQALQKTQDSLSPVEATITTEEQARYATDEQLTIQAGKNIAAENKAAQKSHDAFKLLHQATMARQDNPTPEAIAAETKARKAWEAAARDAKDLRRCTAHMVVRDEQRRRTENRLQLPW